LTAENRKKLVFMKWDDCGNQLERRHPMKRRQTKPRLVHVNTRGDLAAVDNLTRTKALLLAALRVWELKRRTVD
jgi:hypothetical protein